MRIALPLSGGVFSQHFGQSTAFWICDVQQNPPGVSDGRELPMPEGGGCGVIPAMLSQAGVNLVIAGGMGAGAVQNLCAQFEHRHHHCRAPKPSRKGEHGAS